ncbi:hypothetical protein DL770_002507 [Monosporascus sp. CRB-9-2]|nr:hypothetical protein DL770_002507 [Monosporascus sp. CRB-9-2]
MGPSSAYATDHGNTGEDAPVKTEEGDTEMAGVNSSNFVRQHVPGQFPQNLLILALENGMLLFLYVQKGPAGNWEFVSSQHPMPRNRLVHPGFHMTIDPSSSYLTLACVEDYFITFELESMENLRLQCMRGHRLKPVRSSRARGMSGIIHKIEYLHPSPENDYHVILLLIVVKDQTSRLVLYEWEQGDNLRRVFAGEREGHKLADEYRLPLLVIPLTVRNAFLIVTENVTATCTGILQGSPSFEPFELEDKLPSTEYHDGTVKPLWTSWSRPYREYQYHTDHDVLYLAREDGLLNLLDISEDPGVEVAYNMGSLECTIDSAFTCMYDTVGDVLIAGGNCCPGTICSVEPRRQLERVGTIPNWSPAIDIAIACESTKETEELARDTRNTSLLDRRRSVFRRSDRVFVSSGRGKLGGVTELRHGIQAKIGQVAEMEEGFLLLLSLPDRSAIIHFSEDFEDIIEREHDTVPYDLSSRTLAAQGTDDAIIQVTTSFIIVVTSSETSRKSAQEITGDSTATITHASIQGNLIALAVHSQSGFIVRVLMTDGAMLSTKATYEVEGEVTCLALGRLAGEIAVFLGTLQAQAVTLATRILNELGAPTIAPESIEFGAGESIPKRVFASAATDLKRVDTLNAGMDRRSSVNGPESVEALTSIISVNEGPQQTTLAVGTRSGHVFTIRMQAGGYETYSHKFGASPAQVFPISGPGEPSLIMVCNNFHLAMMTNFSADDQPARFRSLHRVFPTDPNDPIAPSINSVARIQWQIPEEVGTLNLAMIAGNRILFTQLQRQPQPVPRHIPVGGTPTKVLYSSRLEALVTVVSRSGIPSLHFLELETGSDLSRPVKETKDENGERKFVDTDYIDCLGAPGTRIISLSDWRYQHGGRTWEWIVIAGKVRDDEGLLLVVSAEPERYHTAEGPSRRVRFWSRLKRIVEAPVWSVTTDEHGVFICFGLNIHYLQVNPADKKLRLVKEFELLSPAAWMQVVDGRLHVATTKHSLMILDYKGESTLGENQMVLLHSDPVARTGIHSIEVGSFLDKERLRSITMLSDNSCGVHGLWSTSSDDEPLKLVFQAQLEASVRRFTRGHTRPPWELATHTPRFGCIQSARDTPDILGISLDGSLRHFTLLKKEAWLFLRFIQNLAMASSTICPHTYPSVAHGDFDPEPQLSPKHRMHVDGDILQRCLDQRMLENLMSNPEHATRFRVFLRALVENQDMPAPQSSDDNAEYFKLAYSVLEYYLAPVL